MTPSGIETALIDSGDYFVHLATILVPLFIGASFLVGLVEEYLPPETVEEILQKRNRGSGNVAAAGLGAVTPFCILNLDHLVKNVQITTNDRTVATDGGTTSCSCSSNAQTTKTHRKRIETAAGGAWSFFTGAFPYLLLGMILGALIHGAVPASWLQQVAGNPLAVPLAALAGAPLYVSMAGMLGIAAPLVDQGVPIGTVIAFVVGGAGVSIPNLILLNKLFERKLLAIYAVTVVTTGTMLGYGLNFISI